MGKIGVLIHVSLDGYLAGPADEIDWIKVDAEVYNYTNTVCFNCDTVIFGRKTFGFMETYWPTAGDKPDASKHDIEHSRWINNASKLVFSKSLQKSEWKNTKFIPTIDSAEIINLKKESAKNLIIIGSASIIHAFIEKNLIDTLYITVNPIILGNGVPLFEKFEKPLLLELKNVIQFHNGVVGLQYDVKNAIKDTSKKAATKPVKNSIK